MNSTEDRVEIPPDLQKYARKRRKPSKKFIIILSLSGVLILIGYAVVFILPLILPKKKHDQPLPQDVVIQYRVENSTGLPEMKKEIISIKPPEQTKEPPKVNEEPKPQPKLESSTETRPHREPTQPKELAKQEQAPQKPESNQVESSTSEPFKGADFLYRANDYERRGLLSEAINEYINFINHTNSPEPKILNKISALYFKLGKLKEAEHYSELALKSQENSREILINYGVIKAKLGELDKAEEAFERVLKSEPQNRVALFNLALIKEKRGKINEAIALLERLQRLGDRDVTAYLERLKRQSQ